MNSYSLITGMLPPVRKNIELKKGWFEKTLPPFLEQHKNEKVSYISIDNDLYNGSVFILEQLMPRFKHHTVVHFHELIRSQYNAKTTLQDLTANAEMKALYYVMQKNPSFKLQLMPFYGPHREPVVFRVIKHEKSEKNERNVNFR